MIKLHFSTVINAPQEKVWHTVLDNETYSKWTKVFGSESHYEGSWTTGTHIRFTSIDSEGGINTTYSKVKEVKPYDFVSLSPQGYIVDNKEQPFGGDSIALENYTFKNIDSTSTEFSVDVDVDGSTGPILDELWPKALDEIKKLAEE
jgi:uncharacterized protein YndB with AHSA1/START domain